MARNHPNGRSWIQRHPCLADMWRIGEPVQAVSLLLEDGTYSTPKDERTYLRPVSRNIRRLGMRSAMIVELLKLMSSMFCDHDH